MAAEDEGGTRPAHPSTGGSAGGGGGGSPFLRQIGPLPLWAWMGLVLAVALVYSIWRKNKTSAKTSSTASTTAAGTQTANNTPPFIIQNYPPNGGTTTGTTTSTTTGTALTPTKIYTTTGATDVAGGRDDTPVGIAMIAYGEQASNATDIATGAALIQSANPQIDWSKHLPVGTQVNIPVRTLSTNAAPTTTIYDRG